MTLKSENALLLTTRNQVVLQGTNKSFQDVHLNAKVYWISTASLWNSTTVVILVFTIFPNTNAKAGVWNEITFSTVSFIFHILLHIFWNMAKKNHFRAFNGSKIVSIWGILVKLGCIKFFTFINYIGAVKKEWKRVKKPEKHEKS